MPDDPEIRIVFGRERSRYYDDVVNACKRLGKRSNNDYMQGGRGHSIRHVFLTRDPRTAHKIWKRVDRWNSAKIFIGEERATIKTFRRLVERAERERRKRWIIGGVAVIAAFVLYYMIGG